MATAQYVASQRHSRKQAVGLRDIHPQANGAGWTADEGMLGHEMARGQSGGGAVVGSGSAGPCATGHVTWSGMESVRERHEYGTGTAVDGWIHRRSTGWVWGLSAWLRTCGTDTSKAKVHSRIWYKGGKG